MDPASHMLLMCQNEQMLLSGPSYKVRFGGWVGVPSKAYFCEQGWEVITSIAFVYTFNKIMNIVIIKNSTFLSKSHLNIKKRNEADD